MAQNWTPGLISVDDDLTVVEAEYVTDYRWNGWLCPRMKRDAVERVLAGLAEVNNPAEFHALIDGENFIVVTDWSPEDLEVEVFEPDAEGWYSPGYAGWCWSKAVPVPRTTFKVHFLTCPECDGNRYAIGGGVTRYGVGYNVYDCESGCVDGSTTDLDVALNLDGDADWTTIPDESGHYALAIRVYDDLPSMEVLDVLGVSDDDFAFTGQTCVTWQDLEDNFGTIAVLEARAKTGW